MRRSEFDAKKFVKMARLPVCRCAFFIVHDNGARVRAGYTFSAAGVARAMTLVRNGFAESRGYEPTEMKTLTKGRDTSVYADDYLIATFHKLTRREQIQAEAQWLELQLERERTKPPGQQVPPDILRMLLKAAGPWINAEDL